MNGRTVRSRPEGGLMLSNRLPSRWDIHDGSPIEPLEWGQETRHEVRSTDLWIRKSSSDALFLLTPKGGPATSSFVAWDSGSPGATPEERLGRHPFPPRSKVWVRSKQSPKGFQQWGLRPPRKRGPVGSHRQTPSQSGSVIGVRRVMPRSTYCLLTGAGQQHVKRATSAGLGEG